MDENTEIEFTETLGLIVQGDGVPRIAGRLLGLFVLHGGPFSFGELAERLNVSRGSVSTNTRLLEEMGVIERVAKTGERQDFFRLASDPYLRMIERKRNRSLRAQQAIDRVADTLVDAGDIERRQRVAELSNFFGVVAGATNEALSKFYHENVISEGLGDVNASLMRETHTTPSLNGTAKEPAC